MLVHLNGQLVPAHSATVSVFDRGFLFGDGVYEGIRACEGVAVAMREHLDRMRAGLNEARITGFDPDSLIPHTRDLLEANRLRDASIYWEVTRGAPTDLSDAAHLRARVPTPALRLRPTVFGYVAPLPALSACTTPLTRTAVSVADTRWLRGHLKGTSLMGAALAALDAAERGADDAILIRDGLVTEGIATNVVIARSGRIMTPPDRPGLLLSGVTRRLLLDAVPELEEADITQQDLHSADEIMLVGTFTMVVSVTRLDGAAVGDGRVGPWSKRLLAALVDTLSAQAAERAQG